MPLHQMLRTSLNGLVSPICIDHNFYFYLSFSEVVKTKSTPNPNTAKLDLLLWQIQITKESNIDGLLNNSIDSTEKY